MIKIDKKYFRPLDINFLLGDPSKAKKELNYKPKYKFSRFGSRYACKRRYNEKKKLKIY